MGERLSYILFRFAIKIFSWLSWKATYVISDITYFVLYKIVGYRKDVVFDNLHTCFPQKSEEEIQEIATRFYKNLADIFIETFKFYSTPPEKLVKENLFVENPEVLDKLYNESHNIIVSGAHLGNWELGPLTAPTWFKHQVIVLYKPLKNKYIDQYLKKLRSRYGARMVSIDLTARSFVNGTKPYMVVMLGDQSPGNPDKAYWVDFLGRPTAILHGIELYARRYNLPVYYYDLVKEGRGKYRVIVEKLTDEPAKEPRGMITYKYAKRVEKSILRDPANWLWSHRRWKHTFDPEKHTLLSFEKVNSAKVNS